MGTREIVEAMYRALAADDIPGFLDKLASDVAISEPAFLPYGGSYTGRDDFVRSVGPQVSSVLKMSSLVVDRLLVEDDCAIAIVRIEVEATGQQMEVAEELVVRDGKVVQVRVFVHDAPSLVCAPSSPGRAVE
jgi:ketosteroid isomerase-like protein